jgi:transposase
LSEIADVNKDMYIDILLHLREAVRKKHPEKQRTKNWFLLHYDAPVHQLALVKDFLAKKNVTTLEPLLYSPDLTPAEFYLLP